MWQTPGLIPSTSVPRSIRSTTPRQPCGSAFGWRAIAGLLLYRDIACRQLIEQVHPDSTAFECASEGRILDRANLKKADLKSADLSSAQLNNANLSEANLHAADLRSRLID
jgi:hypothetical protein